MQPAHLAVSDAPTVLAHRTITAPNPADRGDHEVGFLYYGSGTDKQRAEYRDSVTYRTGTVNASVMARMDPAQAKTRKAFWGFDNTKFPLNARVWYPRGKGPFPLVLMVHGNHDMKDFSDPGYAWLGELLASRGFIMASIDENFLNGSMRNENDARGWMLLKHLEVLRALNDSAGKPLYGIIDMSRIALMGHSRGGEAVAIAGAFNHLERYPDDATIRFDFGFRIKALVAIAPVDGQYKPAEQSTPLEDYSYLVIHGSHDGDVSSFSGLIQYNRIRYSGRTDDFKSAIWMYRANHGQWNTVWNNKDNGKFSARSLNLSSLISGEEQRQFGRVVISAFLESVLNDRSEYRALFRDLRSAGDWLPPTMYISRYADARTHWLATFDEDIDVTTGTAPGVTIRGDSLSVWKETDVQSRSRNATFRSNAATFGWNNTPPPGSGSNARSEAAGTTVGDTGAGRDTAEMRWPARVTFGIPDSLWRSWNVDESDALLITVGTTTAKPGPRRTTGSRPDSLRSESTRNAAGDSSAGPGSGRKGAAAASVAVTGARAPATTKPRSAPPPPDTVPPDFSVELEDAGGRKASVPISGYGALRLPIESYVYRRKGRDKTAFPTLSENVMQTFHIPLSVFREVDVARVRAIRLIFDRKPVGQIMIDDLGVTKGRAGYQEQGS